MVLLVCDACRSVMPPLSACASSYCITACLSAVGCWVECCMPQVLYRVRAMRAYQVCNRWAHGMGNETPSRVATTATTANRSAGCYYVVVILQSGLSGTRQDAPAGPLTLLCAAPAAARVPCGTLACTGPAVRHHGDCGLPRQRRGYIASSHARAGPAVGHHGRREPPRQRRGYPASSHARAGPAVRHHGGCKLPRHLRGYPVSSHACADPAVQHHGECKLLRHLHGYIASSHARSCSCSL